MNRLMAIISITMLLLISCGKKEKIVEVPANCPPSPPRGVFSINLSGAVEICWDANLEEDVKGYDVYRGVNLYGDYTRIGTVAADSPGAYQYCYIDSEGTHNGLQYYYALKAYDKGGLESDWSYEDVSGTPRPQGMVTLRDVNEIPQDSGYDLSSLSSTPQAYSLQSTDIYFEQNAGGSYLTVPHGVDVLIQDYGYAGDFDAVNRAPEDGWSSSGSVEAIVGHIYIMKLHETNGYHYAKLYVTEAPGNFVTFDWAYQLTPGNLDLAPPAPGRGSGNNSSAYRIDAMPGLNMNTEAELAIDSAIPPIVERVTWTRDFELGQQTTM